MFIFFVFIFSLMQTCCAQMPLIPVKKNVMYHDNAQAVLNAVFYQQPSPSIITEHEWKEFQLDRLITILDRTKTSFGRWGLTQLLQPIDDHSELLQRKKIISFLINHDTDLSFFQQQLDKIHAVEKSLLSYWDKADALDKGAQQFYYSDMFAGDYLNDSIIALNGSVATKMLDAWKGLLVQLCLGGVHQEATAWLMNEKRDFNLMRGLEAGLYEPLKQHSWNLSVIKQEIPEGGYSYKDYMRAISLGSWMDRYRVLSQGYTFDAQKMGAPSWTSYSHSKATGLMAKIGAFFGASAQTVMYDYTWILSLMSVGKHIISMNQILNQLYERLVDVATCFNAIADMNKIIGNQHDVFGDHYVTDDYNAQVAELLKKISSPRFAHKGSYLYSRGHVLAMHKDIKEVKKFLVPLLQSVAFLDAFCSIAQLYKESQNKPVKFSFPGFVDQRAPLFVYEDAWLPLLSYNQAITNDLCLGGECPGKVIITGPNGGGKSTLLKAYGVAAILAQSWCIVPAEHGKQTLFAAIKTGLAPDEDLEQGLSKGMAERKRMSDLLDAMKKGDATKQNMLVLVDEPYAGTVDDEAAKRIYKFGKDVAPFSHVLLAIATHTKQPIFLEHDTQGIFGNYQVKIKEISPGVFERLFKIEKGPATWWFDNADQRSRFLDWIDTKLVVSH